MKKILVTAFENNEGELIGKPDDLHLTGLTVAAFPMDKFYNVKKLSDNSVQGNYTADIIVTGIEIDG